MNSSRSSSPPFLDETRPESQPPVQWKVPVKWCGGEDGGQDVCIRLVRNSINDQEAGRSPLLALVAAHSRLLVTNCQYFRDMAQKFETTPRPTCTLHEVTICVDGDDVVPYIDCFTTLYNRPQAGEQLYKPIIIPFNFSGKKPDAANVQNIKNILKLLGAASHIGYDALSTSICHHLVEEMDLFSSEIMELAKSELKKEGLPHLIRAYCHSSMVHPHKNVVDDLLRKARDQGWTQAPTLEQGVVAIVEEELKRLLVEARNEYGGEGALTEGNNVLPLPLPQQMNKIRDMSKKACDMLKLLVDANVQSEGVKWLLQNSWIPKLLSREVILRGNDREFNAIITTMVTVYKEVADGNVMVESSDLYVLLKDWTFFMERFRDREARRGPWVQYEKAKKAIFSCLPHNMQTELLVMDAHRGCLSTFGNAEEIWKLLKDKTKPREGQ